jgi:uncharacterized membrane protein YfcA
MTPGIGAILLVAGFLAGFIGALAGIGGGIIITPLLSLYFGVPLKQAIGTSLVAVITTSAASSAVHVQRHVTDVKLGMTLELATALGAAVTAYLSVYANRTFIGLLFSAFLLYSAYTLIKRAFSGRKAAVVNDGKIPAYEPKNYPLGLGASLIAGGMSGLLGIGGGPLKVPVMYIFMGVPLLVATATSNFMIGVTASASAFVYFRRGDILVEYAAPLVVGVFLGSTIGAKAAPKIHAKYVMYLLIMIMLYLAVQMLVRIAGGKLA